MFVLHLLSGLFVVMGEDTHTFPSALVDLCFISLTGSIIVFIHDCSLNASTLLSILLSELTPLITQLLIVNTSPTLLRSLRTTTALDMQRSTGTPALFRASQLAFRSLRWKSTWSPSPRFVALMNEDEDLDLVVISTFDSLDVCCHEELLKMPINGLLCLIVELNSRLSAAMQITDALTKSEDQLRMDIEAVLGYKRFSPTEQKAPAITSRDSGLGLLRILSTSQAPDAHAVSSTSLRTVQQKGSNDSLDDRQKLTVSMRGKPRLADLLEEPETSDLVQPKEKSPIRRSDRQHSLTRVRRNRPGEVATLPRARNLRNLQVYEGRRVRIHLFYFRVHYATPPDNVPRFPLGSPLPQCNDLIGQISMHRLLEASFARNPSSTTPSPRGKEGPPTNQAQLVI